MIEAEAGEYGQFLGPVLVEHLVTPLGVGALFEGWDGRVGTPCRIYLPEAGRAAPRALPGLAVAHLTPQGVTFRLERAGDRLFLLLPADCPAEAIEPMDAALARAAPGPEPAPPAPLWRAALVGLVTAIGIGLWLRALLPTQAAANGPPGPAFALAALLILLPQFWIVGALARRHLRLTRRAVALGVLPALAALDLAVLASTAASPPVPLGAGQEAISRVLVERLFEPVQRPLAEMAAALGPVLAPWLPALPADHTALLVLGFNRVLVTAFLTLIALALLRHALDPLADRGLALGTRLLVLDVPLALAEALFAVGGLFALWLHLLPGAVALAGPALAEPALLVGAILVIGALARRAAVLAATQGRLLVAMTALVVTLPAVIATLTLALALVWVVIATQDLRSIAGPGFVDFLRALDRGVIPVIAPWLVLAGSWTGVLSRLSPPAEPEEPQDEPGQEAEPVPVLEAPATEPAFDGGDGLGRWLLKAPTAPSAVSSDARPAEGWTTRRRPGPDGARPPAGPAAL